MIALIGAFAFKTTVLYEQFGFDIKKISAMLFVASIDLK